MNPHVLICGVWDSIFLKENVRKKMVTKSHRKIPLKAAIYDNQMNVGITFYANCCAYFCKHE